VSFLPAKHQRFVTRATIMSATETRTKSEMIEMAMIVTMLKPVPGSKKVRKFLLLF
jgi:hypothetical protein